MSALLTGVITGGFSFLKQWWTGKQEQAQKELEIKQEEKKQEQNIRLLRTQGELTEDQERVKQMSKSWKDEFFMIIFSIPLVNMFISPFIDLLMLGEYKEGMLANAASQALQNLDNAPFWYIFLIIMMVCLSWGYRKGLNLLLESFNKFKNKG